MAKNKEFGTNVPVIIKLCINKQTKFFISKMTSLLNMEKKRAIAEDFCPFLLETVRFLGTDTGRFPVGYRTEKQGTGNNAKNSRARNLPPLKRTI